MGFAGNHGGRDGVAVCGRPGSIGLRNAMTNSCLGLIQTLLSFITTNGETKALGACSGTPAPTRPNCRRWARRCQTRWRRTTKTVKAWSFMALHLFRGALRRTVSAATSTVFVQEPPEAARQQWCSAAEQFRGKLPRQAVCLDDAGNDVFAFMTLPRAHASQVCSTKPPERLDAEIKRRTNVAGIFPTMQHARARSAP